MGQALYRTHRPTSLKGVVGQEHITTALTRALAKGTISHAYLFTGPRGVGKTSIARILAHEINGLPYDDSTHLDIIEIDAASNRRIDEIRDLRDKVHIAPTSAKYKVYIIDEVHMLTKEAFNALLKTLEEPPAHVVFILATTEVHKLPETIISRTQRFSFKAVEQDKVVAHLREIAKAEKIDITDDALELIARHGEGSFRDSISLLDQIRNTGEKITLVDVQACLGLAPEEFIQQLVDALEAHDANALASSFGYGYEPAQIARQLGAVLRQRLLSGTPVGNKATTIALLQKLIDVPASPNPHAYLDIALLDAGLEIAVNTTPLSESGTTSRPPGGVFTHREPSAEPNVSAARTPTRSEEGADTLTGSHSKADNQDDTKSKIMKEEVAKPEVQIEPHPSAFRRTAEAAKAEEPSEINQAESTEGESVANSAPNAVLTDADWPKLLAAVKVKHNTLYSIVRTVRPHFEPGKIVLECSMPFYQKRLNENRNKEMLGEVLKTVTGQDLRIECIVGEGPSPDDIPITVPQLPPEDAVVHAVAAESVSAPPQSEAVKAISNIFGGAELLES
ncbi:MAG TPA: DNA polymerase III subunit gamma/tau [Candidatus Saccharimonadales bacterium]|nr:DNA polymerase III subunit gamma/tau [Candidatus Saccharimonadales bacterium]